MAFIRVVTLFFSITYYNYVAGLQVDYTENISIFDAKIGCDIAKLAWDYASKLLPAQRNLHSVYDALELHKCNTTNYRKAVETKSGRSYSPAENEAFVDPEHGSDSNPGTVSHPVKTIDKALSILRAAPIGRTKAMHLKGATYYLESTLELGPEDSGLTILPWGGDEVILSGGRLYKLAWTEYKNEMKPIEQGLDGIADLQLEPGASRQEALFYGKVLSVEECSTACVRNKQCNGFTYYDASSHTYPMMCYLRMDGQWNPVRDVSGSSFSSQKIHIVVADLSDQSPNNFTSLFINSRRAVRARYPDGNPETSGLHTNPTGYVPAAERWLPPATKEPGEEIFIRSPNRTGSYFPFFQIGKGGSVSVFNPPQSYWGTANPSGGGGFTYRVPTGLQFSSNLSIADRTWSNPSTGVVHTFHCKHWGGWQFKLDGRNDKTNHTLTWSYGGIQEARGCDNGSEWYVENIFEELDSPGEWFLDYDTHKLYFSPNGTLPTEAVGTNLEVILSIKGSQSYPVKNIAINDITFAHSATTFLSDYEVPSGGDWTVHRGAAVVVEGAENVTISKCLFYSPGGNGLLLNNYVRGAVIEGNEFVWVGDNAIVVVGSTQLIDGTDGNQPRGTKVIGNLVHEVGVFGKQVCAYVQSLACETELIGNVFFNGPRAGINFNDGFGGGNIVKNNVLFNFVRETLDHGTFNSWDRQPYLTKVRDGKTATLIQAESFITQNLFVGNFH
ncbi:uncharacterized protein [Dysidea avara]|uniref:uncharacterized protein n=1 Tax=Dysidea avara TaxID=196820 RepID=UPI00332A7D16